MLKTIHLHNLRSFLNFRADFTPLHLVIGRNNSGKTNLARAIQFLSWTSANTLEFSAGVFAGGLSELRHRQLQSGPTQIGCTCELQFRGKPIEYSYVLELDITQEISGKLNLVVTKEILTCNADNFLAATLLQSDGREARMLHETEFEYGHPQWSEPTLAPPDGTMLSRLYELRDNPRATLFKRFLSNWAYFSLSPYQMRYGWQDAKESFALYQLGNNLVQAIYQLKNQDELRYRRLVDRARILEPDLRAINFIPSPGQAPVPFVQMDGGAKASWAGLSDGTLRALGLATLIEQYAFYTEAQASVVGLVIIEEPENGIAPAYLRRIYDFFADAPAAQFIFTSHSPYFIDFFDADRQSVSLLRQESGHSVLVSAVDRPEITTDSHDRLTLADEYASELIG